MWIVFAIGASILWGFTYIINEHVYKEISFFTTLTIGSFFLFVIALIVSYFSNNLILDISNIISSKKLVILLIAETVTFILAEFFIAYSITEKNATLSGLVEISYPIFIIIFAYIFFHEKNINTLTLIGGLLIFTGVFMLYYFNN